jgi:hypothetical protein
MPTLNMKFEFHVEFFRHTEDNAFRALAGFVSDVIHSFVFLVTERVRVAHRAANETRVEAGREVISLSYFVGGDDRYLSLFRRADMSERVDPVSREWGRGRPG